MWRRTTRRHSQPDHALAAPILSSSPWRLPTPIRHPSSPPHPPPDLLLLLSLSIRFKSGKIQGRPLSRLLHLDHCFRSTQRTLSQHYRRRAHRTSDLGRCWSGFFYSRLGWWLYKRPSYKRYMAVATGMRNFLRLLGGKLALAGCAAILNNSTRCSSKPLCRPYRIPLIG